MASYECLVFLVLLAGAARAQFRIVDNSGSENLPTSLNLPQAPVQRQLGCAAALICVEERFCTMTGMISPTPLSLTPEQKLRQVPMVDCRNPENGVDGKCCRDPNYVDPWPAGDFPKNYQGAFDSKGFPVAWNITGELGKKAPANRPIPAAPVKRPVPAAPTPGPFRQPSPQPILQTAATNQREDGSNFIPQGPFPSSTPVPSSTPIPQQAFPSSPFPQRPQRPIVTPFPQQPSPSPFPQQPSSTPFPQRPSSTPFPQRPSIATFPSSTPFPQQPSSTPLPPIIVPEQPARLPFQPQTIQQPQFVVPAQPQQPNDFVESVSFGQPLQPANPPKFVQQPQQPPKTFNIPNIPNIPEQIYNNFVNRPEQQGEVVEGPAVVADEPAPASEKPGGIFGNFPNFQLPSLPSIPNIPNFPGFGKEIAPTSVRIEPHQPGNVCGIINQVSYDGQLKAHEVPFGEIPWMVMILNNVQAKPICSGALVAPDRVLTAAHCVDNLRESEVSIKVGEWKLGYDLRHEEPYPTEIVSVESIIPHPAYHEESAAHDMVVLKLQRPVRLDQHVDTICVSESVQIPVASQRKCISVGWGKPAMSIHAAGAVMNKIDVSPLSNFECTQRIQNAESPIQLDDSLVCVKALDQSANMCMVDGGSPLACEREDGTYEIVGVYSRETGCQPTNQVATFAKIDAQWVNNASPFQVAEQKPVEKVVENYVNYPGSIPAGINEYLPPV